MTKRELMEMEAEDEQLREILQDHYFGENEERKVFCYDQPAYYTAEQPDLSDGVAEAIDAYYQPIVTYGVPKQLKESTANAAIPAAVAILFWALHMSGDASTALALSIGIPALAIAILGAISPWVRK